MAEGEGGVLNESVLLGQVLAPIFVQSAQQVLRNRGLQVHELAEEGGGFAGQQLRHYVQLRGSEVHTAGVWGEGRGVGGVRRGGVGVHSCGLIGPPHESIRRLHHARQSLRLLVAAVSSQHYEKVGCIPASTNAHTQVPHNPQLR
eukprot:CAMPEP_0173245826 /NCGR_PEP_ID=MMETSP1142-20121109/16966_1 /TAXON_ID=483371 /ORGANISM="non described non described, Strain CCMP2298" /LENGTH=144 /DNA_ID=CAMNT_0014177959 /DNA_START=236 /DNA_END=666 /DNA_ORIENTATION=+